MRWQVFATAAVVGFLLGVTAPLYRFLGWLSLIPWAISGMWLLYRSALTEAVAAGALYGFVLCFSFVAAGYAGAAPVLSRVPFFSLIGAIGGVCGALLGMSGTLLKMARAR